MQILSNTDIQASPPPEMLDSLPLPTMIVDSDGLIERANQLMGDLLNEQSEYLIGRTFLEGNWQLLHENGSVMESSEELLAGLPLNRAINGSRIGLVAKNITVWLGAYARPHFSNVGDYLGAVVTFVDITTSAESEQHIEQKVRRLRSVPEHQTNYIIRTDLEGNFLYLNQAALTQFDHGDEDDVFRSLNYLTDPMYAIRCIKAAAYCIDHPGSVRHIEIRCYNKEREYFWTSWELVGISDELGEVIEIQAVGQDISKKKRMADLLGETSQMARIGGWEISSFSRRISWTPETYRIHDIAEDTPVSMRRAIRFFYEEHQPILRLAYRKLIVDGVAFDIKLRMRTALNRDLWVRVIGQRETVHGNFVRAYGVIQDITESQRSKEELKHREWLLKSVFNSTADALLIVDQNRKIVDCNHSVLRIFEIGQKEDAVGLDTAIFQKDPFDEEKMVSIRKAVDEAGLWTSEVEFVSSKKRPFWGSLAITSFPGMDYVIVRVTDITEQKEAEAQLLESNQHLKKTNEELDRFVYSASHDLRAPLTSILGLISLSKMEEMNDQVQDYLIHMEKSANRLDDFIKELTHFSRNARLQITSEPIQFDKIVNELFEQYQFMDYQVPVKTYLEIDQNEVFYTDTGRLQIVLGNIISNAMKYRVERESESYVKIAVDVNSKEATIRIEDNGMGIAAEHQAKIFDMFYRADNHKPGSGLGLYIVKETVEKLQGYLEISSEQGKGTEFVLHLPHLAPTLDT